MFALVTHVWLRRRKYVAAAEYLLRTYVYTARKISSPSGALPNPLIQVC